MEIDVVVQGQTLHPLPIKRIVSGSQNFVKFVFHLDEDWLSVTSSPANTFAQFVQNGNAYNAYLNEDSFVYLPSEIGAGECRMMLYGTNNTVIATSNSLRLIIEDSGLVIDASSIEITQDLYSQMVNMVNSVVGKSPRPVHAASEMTDTETVYIYLGSESGYVNGAWYYYNGLSWAVGGQYVGAGFDVATTSETISYLGIV